MSGLESWTSGLGGRRSRSAPGVLAPSRAAIAVMAVGLVLANAGTSKSAKAIEAEAAKAD